MFHHRQLHNTFKILNCIINYLFTQIIFGTADALNIPILTANEGFVRSVKQQVIMFSVIIQLDVLL